MSFTLRAMGIGLLCACAAPLWAQIASDYTVADCPSCTSANTPWGSAWAGDVAPQCDPNAVWDPDFDGYGCYTTCPPPPWTVKAGAVILQRTRPTPTRLIADVNTGETVLDASDFDFNWEAGPDIAVIRSINSGLGAIEARYFSINDSQATKSLYADVWIPTVPPLVSDGWVDIDAMYSSRLYSAEINYRHNPANDFCWLVGFRWVQFDENLELDSYSPLNEATIVFDAENQLYGGQIGLDWRIFDRGGPIAVNSVFKAGVFGNSASNSFLLRQDTGPSFRASDAANQVAFVGEIDITAVYRWTDHIALRGGYQLLWVEGVAVAADQVAATNLITENGIDTRGGVFYQGALVGIDFSW